MKTIDEDIKSGQFKKIYLLYGDEAYLKKQYKDKLKKALVQPDDTMNFTAYEGKRHKSERDDRPVGNPSFFCRPESNPD